MKRFSSSYIYDKSNFALIGCEYFGQVNNEWFPLACVVENIIQRGTPTHPSNRLKAALGEPPRFEGARPARKLITHEHQWQNTIKGAPSGQFNPALDFFETLLPSALDGSRYILNYILPEARIEDIVDSCDSRYKNQRVDFFCPRANLVIEIDGSQHGEEAESYLDRDRNLYLESFGITTIRIPVKGLEAQKVAQALNEFFDEGEATPEEFDEKMAFGYELALRIQIALIELIKQGTLSLTDPILTIDFTCDQPDFDIDRVVRAAVEDIFDLFEHLCILQSRDFHRPDIRLACDFADVRLDISATKMWSEIESEPGVVYVRNDYYELDDFFYVAHTDPIVYKTMDEDRRKDVDISLKFFLEYLFDYSEFNPGQAGIIRRALARDATLGILPTGSGKSLCYQMACLLQPCISFVVCPIISLIQDQEYNTREFGIDRVGRIESQMDTLDKNIVIDDFGRGKYFFVWVSPERFQMVNFRSQLSEIQARRNFGYAVIDEVHCLSEWGHDFRVSYLKLYGTIKFFCPEAQTLALTATASRNVLEDLLCELEIKKENVQTSSSLDRPELTFHVIKTEEQNRQEKLGEVLDMINYHFCMSDGVASAFEVNEEKSICGIVFSNTTQNRRNPISSCDGVLAYLRQRNIVADSYHSKREDDRTRIQREFLENKFTVMSATKAFGMGVNKKNVRFTIHNGLPWSIEAFYQEAGRAGRDKQRNESECYILYSNESDPSEVRTLFEEQTSVKEIQQIQPSLVGDLGTLFFLWNGNHEELDIERSAIVKMFKELTRRRKNNGHALIEFDLLKKLMWDDILERMKHQKGSKKAELNIETQDTLYKLAVLGIVLDWTVDYRTKTYDVEMQQIDCNSEEMVKNALESYIKRHNPTFSFENPLPSHKTYVDAYSNAPGNKKLIGLIDVLLMWTNDSIVFSRRRSIGNMLDLCESDRNEVEIREYINRYFLLDAQINDQLDIIVRDTSGTDSWVRLFMTYKLTDDPNIQEAVVKDAKEIETVAAQCDRYRESYHANIGLEWSTMIAKLLSGTFSEADIDDQFKFITSGITEYENLDADELFAKTLALVEFAGTEAKNVFATSVVRYVPERAMSTYERLGDFVTLGHLVSEASNRLGTIWGRTQN